MTWVALAKSEIYWCEFTAKSEAYPSHRMELGVLREGQRGMGKKKPARYPPRNIPSQDHEFIMLGSYVNRQQPFGMADWRTSQVHEQSGLPGVDRHSRAALPRV
jgi:hypothetical protein